MSSTDQQGDLPFNAPMTPEEELIHLRRAKQTLDSITDVCLKAGHDGSVTLVEFIESRIQPK